jgi:hypothetical protein
LIIRDIFLFSLISGRFWPPKDRIVKLELIYYHMLRGLSRRKANLPAPVFEKRALHAEDCGKREGEAQRAQKTGVGQGKAATGEEEEFFWAKAEDAVPAGYKLKGN